MTDYCTEIAALLDEMDKIPEPAAATCHRERGRNSIQRKILHRQIEELQTQAAKEFAALNSWRLSRRLFLIKTLAQYPWEPYPRRLIDHPVFFREVRPPYRPVAVVAQPYDTAISVDQATGIAHSLGLGLHTPPNPLASWWYPTRTRFFCLTRPGVEARFLPDQLTFELRSPRDSDAGTDAAMQV